MNILGLDTCFDACSVAVLRHDGECFAERDLMRRGHAEALVPMMARVMSEAAIGFDELDRIAVTTGPGTFTGARVGVSAALGAALAHNIDIVTYSSLTCITRAAHNALGPITDQYDGIIVARDARRDSVYWELLDNASLTSEMPVLLSLADARQRLAAEQSAGRQLIGMGSGIVLLDAGSDTLTPLATALPPEAHLPQGIDEPDARYMLIDAATRKPDPNPTPLYLRAPDAKPSSTPPLPRQALSPSSSTDTLKA